MKEIEVLKALPKDKPIPPAIVTKVSRLRDKDESELSNDERILLQIYDTRRSYKRSFLMMSQEEGTGQSEVGIASVYIEAIKANAEVTKSFLEKLEKNEGSANKALIEVLKFNQESIKNAAEREEMLMERLRKETKRADKYEDKYQKTKKDLNEYEDIIDDLESDVEKLKNEKGQDKGTLADILGVIGKLTELKKMGGD